MPRLCAAYRLPPETINVDHEWPGIGGASDMAALQALYESTAAVIAFRHALLIRPWQVRLSIARTQIAFDSSLRTELRCHFTKSKMDKKLVLTPWSFH